MIRDIERRVDGFMPAYKDDKPVARLELNAESLEFIIDNLPQSDEFTRTMRNLRDAAKDYAWDYMRGESLE